MTQAITLAILSSSIFTRTVWSYHIGTAVSLRSLGFDELCFRTYLLHCEPRVLGFFYVFSASPRFYESDLAILCADRPYSP